MILQFAINELKGEYSGLGRTVGARLSFRNEGTAREILSEEQDCR